jgi:hypothetical protein
MQHTKTVNGIRLRRAIGRGRRWAAPIDGTPMIFEATLGYRSGKVLFWTGFVCPAHRKKEKGGWIMTGRGNSLTRCVKAAQGWASRNATLEGL